MFTLKRLLVPTDFSEPSIAAVAYAKDLARVLRARLFYLHVPGRTGENLEADFPLGPFEGTAAAVPLAGGDASGVPKPEYAVRIGAPADEINRYARDREIDLIVMGTHGRSGLTHLVMGSVAEQVLRAATCPVLVIRR